MAGRKRGGWVEGKGGGKERARWRGAEGRGREETRKDNENNCDNYDSKRNDFASFAAIW